jgi:predicted RNase H-like HicB family nuclease
MGILWMCAGLRDDCFLMKHRYEINIRWSDTDKAYLAAVPELAGCLADGITYEAALAAAQTQIDTWIHTAKSLGRAIPIPRGPLTFA